MRKVHFFASIVKTLVFIKIITNYISLESSWPVDFHNVYCNYCNLTAGPT